MSPTSGSLVLTYSFTYLTKSGATWVQSPLSARSSAMHTNVVGTKLSTDPHAISWRPVTLCSMRGGQNQNHNTITIALLSPHTLPQPHRCHRQSPHSPTRNHPPLPANSPQPWPPKTQRPIQNSTGIPQPAPPQLQPRQAPPLPPIGRRQPRIMPPPL